MSLSTKSYKLLPLLAVLFWLFSTPVQMMANGLSLSVTVTAANASCTGADGIVSANPDGGLPPYTYLWSNGATDKTLTGLTPGTYTVTVTDQTGATASDSGVVNSAAGFQISLQSSYETCTGSSDAKVDVVFDVPGRGPYTFLWSTGATTAQLSNVGVGTYSVTVTDADGCQATGSHTVVLSPEGVWIMTSSTDTECGQSNGSVYVGAMTGVPPYTYLWSNGSTSNNPMGLPAGTYTVTVTDSNGCTAEDSATVNGSNPPDAGTIFTTDATTFCTNDGIPDIVNVTASGNTASNYTFVVTDSNGTILDITTGTQFNFEGAPPGNCSIYGLGYEGTINGLVVGQNISGISGCFDWAGPIVVTRTDCSNPCDAEAGSISTNDATTFCTSDGIPDIVNVTSTGNTSTNFTYVVTDSNGNILDITTGTQFNFEGAPPGNCSIYGLGYEGTINGLVVGQNISGITGCFDWAGPIVVTRTDCPDPCDANAGTLSLGAGGSPICLTNGAADLSAIPNGDALVPAGYEVLYVLTSGAGLVIEQTSSTPNFTVNSLGSYTIHTLVYDPNTLDLSIVVPGTTTGFDVNGLLIQGGGSICASLDVAGAKIVVEDCPDPCDANAGTLSLGAGGSPICLTNGAADLSAIPNGDAVVPAGYEVLYVLTSGAGLVIEQTSSTPNFTVNSLGSYTIHTLVYDPNTLDLSIVVPGTTTGFDVNGLLIQGGGSICASLDVAGAKIVVEDCPDPCQQPILLNVVVIKSTCGKSDGKATVNVAGDPNAFEYEWDPAVSNTFVADGIPAGTYHVTISDPSDPAMCNLIETFTVGTKDGPVVTVVQQTPATCKEANGTATLSPANYVYEWCNGATGNNVNNLAAGECQVTVTDPATNCTTVIEIDIDAMNPLTGTARIDAEPDCKMANGAVTILPVGGSFNYSYAWSDGGTGESRNDLASGTYFVTITDLGPTACEAVVSFILKDNVPGVEVEVEPIVYTSCPDSDDATVVYTVTPSPGFAGPAVEVIKNANGDAVVNGKLSPGFYCIEVTDANDCVAGGACFEVKAPLQLDVDVTILNKDCNRGGSISLDIIRGTAPYSVAWSDGSMLEDRIPLVPGTYGFTVTDANGCTAFADGLTVADSCKCSNPGIESVVVIEATCGNDDGSAVITPTGDPSNFTYTWDPPVSAVNTAFNIAAGFYEVTITDAGDDACFTVEKFTVGTSDGPDAEVTTTDASCGSADGTVTLTPTNYTYNWRDGYTGDSRTGLAEGSYLIEIVNPDTPACTNFITAVVGNANTLRASATVDSKPSCNNADGSATISVTGGSGTYDFLWADGSTLASRSGLASGAYSVTITDVMNIGCTTILTFPITDDVPEAEVNVTSTSISVDCKGMADGRVEFSPTYSAGFVQPADIKIVDALGREYDNGDLAEGDYCILIRDANGCLAGATCFEVGSPSQIDMDLAVFDGKCQTLGKIEVTDIRGGNGGYLYDWQDLAGTDNMKDRNDLAPGNYTLIVNDAKGCAVQATLEVEVDTDSVTVNTSEDMVSCDSTAAVSASGNNVVSYTWYNAAGMQVGTGADTVLDATSSTFYYVIALGTGGCEATDTIRITEGALDVDLVGPKLACEGTLTELQVINNDPNDTLTYVWSPSNMIMAGGNTAMPTINTDSLGDRTYSVIVTNQEQCSVTRSITVGVADTTLNADPIATRQCEPGLIEFSLDGLDATYYTWNFGDMNTDGDTAQGQSPTYTYPEPGFYTVTLSLPNGTGCPTDTISKLIEVVAPPLSTPGFDVDINCGDTAFVSITDQSGFVLGTITDWTWVFNGTDTSRVQNPTIEVTQTQDVIVSLLIMTDDGCESTLLDTIPINLVEEELEDIEVCPGEMVELNAGGDTNYNYVWTPGDLLNDPTTASPMTLGDTSRTFTAVISNADCEVTRTMDMTVRSELSDFTAIGDSTNTCDRDDITISASGAGTTGFVWSDGLTFTDTLGTTADLLVTPGEPGMETIYYVEGTDRFGCTKIDSAMVTNREVSFEFQADVVPVCFGFDKEVVIILEQTPGSVFSVDWTPNEIIKDLSDQLAPIINPTEDTELTAFISNQYGCSKEETVDVDVINLDDVLTIESAPDTVCRQGDQVQLFVTEDPTYSYTWTDDGTLDRTDIFNPTALPGSGKDFGTRGKQPYSVVVTDENGCTGTRNIEIEVIIPDCDEPWIFFPNAFTPNDDGNNDVLRPRGFSIDEVYWVVYNRWGEKMFEANNKDQSWDGTYKGEKLSPDVYGYYLRVTCIGGRTFSKKGNVTLLR